MSEPRTGVVLLNWNGCDDTIAALESLYRADPRPESVVVIDNGSSDDSLERLRVWAAERVQFRLADAVTPRRSAKSGHDTWLTILAAGANHGFSGGNNIGLRYLAGDERLTHFLLLNNDAMVAPDYFERIAGALERVPDAGLVGCTIFCHPARDQVWFSGGYEVPWRALVLHHFDPPAGDSPRPTPFVTGCAMLIARPLYEAEGGLAECYNPVYWEDSEYSFRARARGWKLVIAPAAHVFHRGRATGGGETLTPRVAFVTNRNRALYVRRNYRGLDRFAALTYLAITKPGRAVAEVLRGRPAVGAAILKGYVRGITLGTA